MALINPTGVVTERRLSEFYQGILPYLNGDDGGGHEILGNGTAVAQENKLDFIGVSVTDDSTNEKTVVQGTGLNQDSLDDIAGASLPSTTLVGNGLNYSTNEQIVGRWIDGKPLYQRTFEVTTDATAKETRLDLTAYIPNMDQMFISEAFLKRTNGASVSINAVNGDAISTADVVFICYIEATKKLYIRTGTSEYNRNAKVYATIRYTKTTDT